MSLLRIAEQAHCDGVHPGYGFLAEQPAFARACIAAGLTWVGPSPEVMETLGNKVAARALAERAKVPVCPATGALPADPAVVRKLAAQIGFR
jgi:pyruvate carboxylase